MSLTTSLEPDVPYKIRTRGKEYYNHDAVTLDLVTHKKVEATVEGTEDYEVDLLLEGKQVFTSCNCPYFNDQSQLCKHIWATILAAEPKGFAKDMASLRLVLFHGGNADDEDYDDDDLLDLLPPPPVTIPKVAPKPKNELWKEQLAVLRKEVQPKTPNTVSYIPLYNRQLAYIVDAVISKNNEILTIEFNIQDRKKNGDWGVPKPQTISKAEVDRLTDPLDRQLYSLLVGAERIDRYSYYSSSSYGVSRYRVYGALLDTILPTLAQTNRVYLRLESQRPTDLTELTIDLDSPWEFVVKVTRGEVGQDWMLSGSLHRGDKTMSLNTPSLIVPGAIIWEGRLGRFDDVGAFAWVKTLRNVGTISVPADRADDLLDELLQMPQLPRLELHEELGYTEEAVTPQPRLVIKQPKQVRAYGTPVLNVELSFDYLGTVVPSFPQRRGIFQSEGRRLLLRDIAFEQSAMHQLNEFGVAPASNYDATLNLNVKQLSNLVRELTPAGWNIVADGKLYRPASEFNLAVRTDRDWFELNGNANFDGQIAPFPKLLEALKRGDSTIVLDDGSIGLLPEEWLNKHGLLAQMGNIEDDTLRFSKAQVGVLDALLASRPEITFDKQFARARDSLKKFQGIKAAKPPAEFQGTLRDYQREGLGWLRFLRKFGFGGCLADEMGLGKTVQVLALLAGKRDGPALIVVPKSLIFNWKSEAERFAPQLKVLDHTGLTRDRVEPNFTDYDIVLTTYGTLRNDAELMAKVRFDTCVLDESQAAKNITTETAKAVRVVQADHRLALSGTPVENHLGELWTLFDFLNPGMLGKAMLTSGTSGSIRNPDAETREFLSKALKPFILRRTKNEVAKDLPEKTEQTIYCDLEPAQRKLYDELRDHYRQSLLKHVDSVGLKRSKIQVLEALLRLRQAACHPGLIDKKRINMASAKLDYLLPQLTELAESGHKVLVFSQFTSLLAIVRAKLDRAKMTYEYLDGKTRDRQTRVERFQTDPECKLFLVSLKAGGVGLNLTAAEYVYLLDPWWNPAVEAQAIDRTHRIGQTRSVFAYRLIARNTVEEKVLALQESKRELADAILGGDGRLITDLKREDLEMLLS